VSRRWSILVLGLLILAVVTLTLGCLGDRPSAESRWRSDYGPLVLRVASDGTVSGSYPDYGGRIIAALDAEGASISGHWFQDESERECSERRDGTRAWGRVWFEFSGGDRIRGVWAYCDEALDGGRAWNARLTEGHHPRDVRWR
jgi:hypothetical protein